MDTAEVEALASRRGTELCAAAQVMSQQDVSFHGALEQVRSMDTAAIAVLVAQRMSKLGKKLNC